MAKNTQKLEEGKIVLCTVDRIIGTIVFVKIEDYNQEGTITFSEISPGRIRNIRDYAFPGKKIVCKVLRIRQEGIDLSLRRVKLKEKTELNEAKRKEKSFLELLRNVVKEKAEEVLEEIKQGEESLEEFLETSRNKVDSLLKYLTKPHAEKIHKTLKDKKEKEIVLKKRFSLSSKDSDGMNKVKEILKQSTKDCKEKCDISYIAAGKYLIQIKTKDPKKAESELNQLLERVNKSSSEKKCSFGLIK